MDCFCSQLVGVEGAALKEALTHKKIIAKGEEVGLNPLSAPNQPPYVIGNALSGAR